MTKIVLLDATPLGLLSNPKNPPVAAACKRWVLSLRAAGHRIIVPEISDYEVRRELMRAGKMAGVRILDSLAGRFEYLPLTTQAFRLGAELWATARRGGRPTAHPHALDGDVLLAAQAITHSATAIVATANPAHLSQYVHAELWSAITP